MRLHLTMSGPPVDSNQAICTGVRSGKSRKFQKAAQNRGVHQLTLPTIEDIVRIQSGSPLWLRCRKASCARSSTASVFSAPAFSVGRAFAPGIQFTAPAGLGRNTQNQFVSLTLSSVSLYGRWIAFATFFGRPTQLSFTTSADMVALHIPNMLRRRDSKSSRLD